MLVMPNGYISSTEKKTLPIPVLRLAFRPLFWLGALFSIISLMLWGLTYTGHIAFLPFGGTLFWHSHEMLFGFTSAIITGFLLTAVQTWTGVPSIKGYPLAALVMLWLVARILLAMPSLLPNNYTFVITVLDVIFLPISAIFLSIPIIKAKKWRNLFFVPVLFIMAFLNVLMHLSLTADIATSFITLSHVMVLMVALIMSIMGGRVFPMFTANGTKTSRVAPILWLEKLSIIAVFASVIVTTQLIKIPLVLEAIIYLIAGIANFIRALRWRIWVTLKTPLVWSLHISYWAICVGLIMLGLQKLAVVSSVSLALHAITVGGIGLMILAMISRVSLGHTGRIISVGKIMTGAFLLMVFTLIIRVIAPAYIPSYQLLILLACISWALAYAIFIFKYTQILFSPRLDGGEG